MTPEEAIKPYAFHGLDIDTEDLNIVNKNVVTDCPFCKKEDHFYICVEGEKAQCYSCKVCGEEGNLYNFLTEYYNHCKQKTSASEKERLKQLRNDKAKRERGLPVGSYDNLAFNPLTKSWLIPITNTKGSIVNLQSYHSLKPTFACPTPGCTSRMYNGEALGKEYDVVIVCEGVWDVLAMQYLLSRKKDDGIRYVVVGLAGATNQPAAEFKSMAGKKVYLCFDNDNGGKQGLKKATQKLSAASPNPIASAIVWPESTANGFDVGDLVTEYPTEKPDVTWERFEELLEPIYLDSDTSVTVLTEPLPVVPCDNFDKAVEVFKETGVRMTQKMTDGLAIALAAAISCKVPGDPIWIFVIGPSGSGKSLLLETLIESDQAYYTTSFTSKSFISGYNAGGEDPSLLGRALGKCLVVKDYTAIITLCPQELETMYGLMRDAYDGAVHRPFGNNVSRDYNGYFSMIAGVTPEIHTLAHSHLGERFLKFELSGKTDIASTLTIDAALEGSSDGNKDYSDKRTRQACIRSLITNLSFKASKNLPQVQREHLIRISCLARFVALCRAKVSRDADGMLLYEASPESGTRVAKVLVKICQNLAVVYGLDEVDDRCLDLATTVAWDTAYGRQRKIIEFLYKANKAVEIDDLAKGIDITYRPAKNTLTDLYDLSLLSREKQETGKQGRPRYIFKLEDSVKEIIDNCKFKV